LKKFIFKKTNWIEKFLGIKDFSIVLGVEFEKLTLRQHKGRVFRVELNLPLPGRTLRVEKTSDDMIKAIDEAKDVLKKEIKTYKEKIKRKEEKNFRKIKISSRNE